MKEGTRRWYHTGAVKIPNNHTRPKKAIDSGASDQIEGAGVVYFTYGDPAPPQKVYKYSLKISKELRRV